MGKPSTQTSQQQSGPPAAVLANYSNVYNQAANVASQPAQQYGGSLLAGFQPQQVAGFNNINTAANSYQPFLNAASQYANNATSMLSPENAQSTIGSYVNPALQTYINAAGNYMNAGIGQAQNALNYTNTGIGQAQGALGQYTNPAVQMANNSLNFTNAGVRQGDQSLQQFTYPAIQTAANSLQYTNAGIGQSNAASGSMNAQNFGNTVNDYYSPYAKAVIAPTEAQFNQQNAVQQSQLKGNAAAQGAYGGDRAAVAASTLAGQQQMAEAPVIAGLETQGYNQAAQNAMQGAGLGMQSAGMTMAGQQAGMNVAGLTMQGGTQAQNAAAMTMQGAQQQQNAAALGLQGGNQALQAAGMTMAGAQPALQAAGMTMQGANDSLAMGNLNEAGYNAGMSGAQADAWLNSQGGFAMGNLANEAESLGLTGANAQIGAGGMQQQLAQQELNIPYQQFQAAQAYPYQATNFLEGAATGLGGLSGQQGSTTQPGPSGLSQAAGLGLSGLGMAGLLGWSPFAAAGAGASMAGGAVWADGGRVDADKLRAAKSLRRDIVWKPPHRADGGAGPMMNPSMPMAGMGAPMGSPMASNLYGQYAQLPTEKLQELAARMPGNTMLQHAIQMRRMQPQADSAQQQQPTAGLGQQMQSAPGGFSRGGELRRPDGGLIPDMDSFAAAEDPTAGPGGISGMGPMDLTPMPVPPMPPHGMMTGHPRGAGSPADRSSDQFNLQELNRLHGVSGAPPLQQQGLGPQEGGSQDYVDNGTWDQPGGSGGGDGATASSHHGNLSSTSGMLLAAGLGMLGGTSPFPGVNIGRGGLEGLQFGQRAQEHAENIRLRQLQAEQLNAYRQGQLGNTATRNEIYGQRVQEQTSKDQAYAALEMAKAAHLGASHATEGDVLSSAVGSLANGKTINPDTGQPWTRADALMHVKGVDSLVQRRQAQTEQGAQRLDQGAQGLDLRRQAFQETVQQHGLQNDQKNQAMLGQQIKGMSDEAIRIYTASKDPITGAYLMKPDEASRIAGGFRGQAGAQQAAQSAPADQDSGRPPLSAIFGQ